MLEHTNAHSDTLEHTHAHPDTLEHVTIRPLLTLIQGCSQDLIKGGGYYFYCDELTILERELRFTMWKAAPILATILGLIGQVAGGHGFRGPNRNMGGGQGFRGPIRNMG
ncbi:unnamed protein product, partial [Cyprideis torosa]